MQKNLNFFKGGGGIHFLPCFNHRKRIEYTFDSLKSRKGVFGIKEASGAPSGIGLYCYFLVKSLTLLIVVRSCSNSFSCSFKVGK